MPPKIPRVMFLMAAVVSFAVGLVYAQNQGTIQPEFKPTIEQKLEARSEPAKVTSEEESALVSKGYVKSKCQTKPTVDKLNRSQLGFATSPSNLEAAKPLFRPLSPSSPVQHWQNGKASSSLNASDRATQFRCRLTRVRDRWHRSFRRLKGKSLSFSSLVDKYKPDGSGLSTTRMRRAEAHLVIIKERRVRMAIRCDPVGMCC